MLIIWGFRNRTTKRGEGEFHCPSCEATRQYQHKRVSRYFTLYFVPLFATKTLLDYAECGSCSRAYPLENVRAADPVAA